MKTIIAAAKAVMAVSKTAATIALVDAVRVAAHKAGQLSTDDEFDFQKMAARYGGHLVKWKLCPLQELPPPAPAKSDVVETPPPPVQPELPEPSKKRSRRE